MRYGAYVGRRRPPSVVTEPCCRACCRSDSCNVSSRGNERRNCPRSARACDATCVMRRAPPSCDVPVARAAGPG